MEGDVISPDDRRDRWRAVDDRSIDRRLWRRLRMGLSTTADETGPFRVLEAGAGDGSMVARAVEWDLFPSERDVVYTAADAATDLPDRLADWAEGRPVETTPRADGIDLVWPERTVTVRTERQPAAAVVDDSEARSASGSRTQSGDSDGDTSWDLLVGPNVLGRIDGDRLPTLLSGLSPGAYWYFPLTFDGGTRFAPDHCADDAVEGAYHAAVDASAAGDSHAGRHTLDRLRSIDGASISGAAGSDWVLFPDDGSYPGSDAAVLEHVLDTVETAIRGFDGAALDDETLTEWLRTRRRQVDAAELVFVRHQLDLLGQWTG